MTYELKKKIAVEWLFPKDNVGHLMCKVVWMGEVQTRKGKAWVLDVESFDGKQYRVLCDCLTPADESIKLDHGDKIDLSLVGINASKFTVKKL